MTIRVISCLISAVVVAGVLPCFVVKAQGVQAIRGVAVEATVTDRAISRDSQLIDLSARNTTYALLMSDERVKADRQAYSLVQAAKEAAESALASRDDPAGFRAAMNSLARAETRLSRNDAAASAFAEVSRAAKPISVAEAITVPAVHVLVPEVVFVVGAEAAQLAPDEKNSWVGIVGVSTNLVGAVIGTGFEALGSGSLKEYVTNNFSVGAAIPTSGPHKFTSQLGLGLGTLTIGRFTLWPAINIEQLDTADARIPHSVFAADSAEANWSRPGIGLAIPFGSTNAVVERIRSGHVVPIFTIGYTVPYFYPGNSVAALAALFTAKRNEYVKTGRGRFSIGVSIPLLKVKPAPDER